MFSAPHTPHAWQSRASFLVGFLFCHAVELVAHMQQCVARHRVIPSVSAPLCIDNSVNTAELTENVMSLKPQHKSLVLKERP